MADQILLPNGCLSEMCRWFIYAENSIGVMEKFETWAYFLSFGKNVNSCDIRMDAAYCSKYFLKPY